MIALENQGRPVLAVFDLDRTITRNGTFTPYLLSYAARRHAGRLARGLGVLPWAAGYGAKIVSRQEIKERMLRAFIAGDSRADIQDWNRVWLDRLFDRGILADALGMVRRHLDAGHRVILATASFDFYASDIARRLDMIDCLSTRSTWSEDGLILAKIAGENCYGWEKLRRVTAFVGADRQNQFVVTYTDHHSDWPLLEWSDAGFAVNPSPKLRQLAARRNTPCLTWR